MLKAKFKVIFEPNLEVQKLSKFVRWLQLKLKRFFYWEKKNQSVIGEDWENQKGPKDLADLFGGMPDLSFRPLNLLFVRIGLRYKIKPKPSFFCFLYKEPEKSLSSDSKDKCEDFLEENRERERERERVDRKQLVSEKERSNGFWN